MYSEIFLGTNPLVAFEGFVGAKVWASPFIKVGVLLVGKPSPLLRGVATLTLMLATEWNVSSEDD